MVSFPYYSHIFRDSYGNSMGPAYHFRGSHVLGGPWKSHWLRVVRSNHQQMEHNFPPPPSHLAPAWRVIVEGSVPRFVRAQTSCLPVLLHAGRPACPDQSLCWTKLLGLTVKVSQVSCIIPYIISFQKKTNNNQIHQKQKKTGISCTPKGIISDISKKKNLKSIWSPAFSPSKRVTSVKAREDSTKSTLASENGWHRRSTVGPPKFNSKCAPEKWWWKTYLYWDSGTFQRTVKLRGGGKTRWIPMGLFVLCT